MIDSHYITGNAFGIDLYLKESGPIDFSQDYEWTEDFNKRKVFTFREACDVYDEVFFACLFNEIEGIIVPNK